MLRKCFSAGSVIMLASVALVWIGCGSDDPPSSSTPVSDAGQSPRLDSGNDDDPDDSGSGGSSNGGLDGGVKITYGTCQAAETCGGDLVGTWKITGGCLDKSTFDAPRMTCPGLLESDVDIQAIGTVSFTATDTTRNTTQRLSAKIFVPTAHGQGSKCPAEGNSCFLLGIGLTSGVGGEQLTFDKAECKDTAMPEKGCNCAVEKTLTTKATQPYTTSGGTLTTQNPTQTFSYCVNGGSSSYVETTDGAGLKLNVTIAKQ